MEGECLQINAVLCCLGFFIFGFGFVLLFTCVADMLDDLLTFFSFGSLIFGLRHFMFECYGHSVSCVGLYT